MPTVLRVDRHKLARSSEVMSLRQSNRFEMRRTTGVPGSRDRRLRLSRGNGTDIFRMKWNSGGWCKGPLTTGDGPMKRPNRLNVILLCLMNGKAVETWGGTVLESSTRPCLHGSITSPKSTALPKTVKPCHPFRGFLLQKLFLANNAYIPSSDRFIRPGADGSCFILMDPQALPLRSDGGCFHCFSCCRSSFKLRAGIGR